MAKIFKFPVEAHTGNKKIKMPGIGTPIHFGVQDGQFFIWAAVNPAAPEVENEYYLAFTGDSVPPLAKHVGTVVTKLVWHLYALERLN